MDDLIIYNTDDGQANVSLLAKDGTVWCTQAQMAELFNVQKAAISKHLKNLFEDDELDKNSVVSILETTASDGKNYNVAFYSLDAILAVGFRVRSPRGTQFRKWANSTLKEYLQKGFVLNDEKLKGNGGGNYWKELLDRIRDIRSSEKVLYRQVLDLYATSVDYDPKSDESITFFKIVQNKLHFAAHGHTAAEVIYERANADSPFMGLTTFSGAIPTMKDVKIAKNYLSTEELKVLNNLVSGYFDFAEVQAIRHNPMHMKDYIKNLDAILSSTGEKVLTDSGKVSHKQAIDKAVMEYRKYQVKTLSPVEEDYLRTVKALSRKAKSESKK